MSSELKKCVEVQYEIPAHQLDVLIELAYRFDEPPEALIRRAIQEFIEKEEPKWWSRKN